MADKPFRCRVITPEARIFDGNVSYAAVPMWDGSRGIMANAGAIVGKLGPGELRIEFVDRYEQGVKLEESGRKRWFIEGGFMQNVQNELTILASRAIEAEQLDAEAARKELAAAQERTSREPGEMDRITESRARARAKLAMATRR